MLGFNPLQKHPVRQKNCKPGLRLDCFRVRFVNLNFDVARSNVDVAEVPLPHKQAPRIEFGRDVSSIERFQRSLSPLLAWKLSLCAVNDPVRRIAE